MDQRVFSLVVDPAARWFLTELWSGTDFAAHFGVKPETVSRWESGHQAMNATAERLLRVLALRLDPIKDYSILKSWSTGKPVNRNYRIEWSDGWEAVAA